MITPVILFLAQAAPPQTAPPGLSQYAFPVLCFGVIVYFGILRPQQKRTKDLQTLMSTLKTGDKVVTSGGIHGTIANIREGTTLSLKIADNVRIEVDKSAIASVEREKERETAAAAALPAKTV